MSSDRIIRSLAEVFSEELEKLTPSRLEVLKIIDEYYSTKKRWPRAKEVENRYGSSSVYDILSELQGLGWLKRTESKGNKERCVVYSLTKEGKRLVVLSQALRDVNRSEAARMLLERIKLGIEALNVMPWKRPRVEKLAIALANESVKLAQSSLDNKYARDGIMKVDAGMLSEEAVSILQEAQTNEEVRSVLFSNTLRRLFKPFGDVEDGSMIKASSSHIRKLENRLDKLLKYSLLPSRSRYRYVSAMKLGFVKFLRSAFSLLCFFGIMYLISIAVISSLLIYNSRIFYVISPVISYLLPPILVAIGYIIFTKLQQT